jgi:hypothetical protein
MILYAALGKVPAPVCSVLRSPFVAQTFSEGSRGAADEAAPPVCMPSSRSWDRESSISAILCAARNSEATPPFDNPMAARQARDLADDYPRAARHKTAARSLHDKVWLELAHHFEGIKQIAARCALICQGISGRERRQPLQRVHGAGSTAAVTHSPHRLRTCNDPARSGIVVLYGLGPSGYPTRRIDH